MNRFQRLGDECASKEWARKIDDFCWAVIRIINMRNLSIDLPGFVVEFGYIDIDEMAIKDSLTTQGIAPEWADERTKVLALMETGYLDKQAGWEGENFTELLLKAFKYADCI